MDQHWTIKVSVYVADNKNDDTDHDGLKNWYESSRLCLDPMNIDTDDDSFETATYVEGAKTGEDFPIVPTGAYFINMHMDVQEFSP